MFSKPSAFLADDDVEDEVEELSYSPVTPPPSTSQQPSKLMNGLGLVLSPPHNIDSS